MFDPHCIRQDFPILAQRLHGHPLVYMDNAATMQVSRPVLEEIASHYRRDNGNVRRGIHTLSRRSTAALESARETVRAFLNATTAEEIVFTAGTTDGINLAARLLERQIGPGDEILATEMEHHSNYLPWLELCRRTGAALRVVPVTERGELDMAALRTLLNERTRLTAVTWVSNVLGTVNPVEEITRLAHSVGSIVLIDAAQAMRHTAVDVQSLDCELLVFSGHKLGALTGTGVLYGKKELLDTFYPVSYGGGMVRAWSGSPEYDPPPSRLEAGTPNYAGAISLAAALDYLQALDLKSVSAYESGYLRRLEDILRGFPQLRIMGAPAGRAGAVSVMIPGVSAFDFGALLDAQGVAVRTGHLCAMPLLRRFGTESVTRFSPAFYNTEEELARLEAAIQSITRQALMKSLRRT